jgi:hypothetical protein
MAAQKRAVRHRGPHISVKVQNRTSALLLVACSGGA